MSIQKNSAQTWPNRGSKKIKNFLLTPGKNLPIILKPKKVNVVWTLMLKTDWVFCNFVTLTKNHHHRGGKRLKLDVSPRG